MRFYRLMKQCGRRRNRRGAVLMYLIVIMMVFVGVCSLAVDYGHVQLVKSESQRCADATARGCMIYYNLYGQSYASSHAAQLYASTQNPVDANSGTAPTVTVQFGSWNSTTNTFSTSSGSTPAVKVTVTRTAANGNGVPLTWGSVLGVHTIDVHASATAALMGGNTTSVNISANANPYFAGMPSTTTDSYGANLTNNAATQVQSIPVVPGTYISFTNLTGSTSVVAGTVTPTGPAGNSNYIVEHGEDYDGSSYNNPGPENGIANAIMPDDAMMGLFLTNNAPNLTTAPSSVVNWTTSPQANQATYSNLVVQQPFMIGDGQTTSGVTQQFLVPPGATRLFVGIWDGEDYTNNSGSLNGTVNVQNYVQLVQ
jgi:hypothetical protein